MPWHRALPARPSQRIAALSLPSMQWHLQRIDRDRLGAVAQKGQMARFQRGAGGVPTASTGRGRTGCSSQHHAALAAPLPHRPQSRPNHNAAGHYRSRRDVFSAIAQGLPQAGPPIPPARQEGQQPPVCPASWCAFWWRATVPGRLWTGSRDTDR